MAFGDQTSLGYRVDTYKDLTRESALTGKVLNNISYGGLVQLTYSSSEFAKMRFAISHELEIEEGITLSEDTRFETQFVFILGSHPAHDF